MIALLRKYSKTAAIELSSQLAFKGNFLLQVIGPALVFLLIRVNLWNSVYALREQPTIGGYTLEAMLQYQVFVFLVVILGQSFISRNVSEDIRMGRISAFLLYPFGFLSFHLGAFFAVQFMNFLVAIVIGIAIWGSGHLPLPDPTALFEGLVLTAIVSVFWFWLWMGLSLFSFWIEETWVIRVCFVLAAKFLSGAVIPLELFPTGLQEFLNYTPFPYLTAVPVRLFMGTAEVGLLQAASIVGVWGLVGWGGCYALWKRGLRRYCAAGI